MGYTHVLFGAPGTGKTQAGADIIVSVELTRGVKLQECTITSFTVDASNEIIHRIFSMLGITDETKIDNMKKDMSWGTIHSICFKYLMSKGIKVGNVITVGDLRKWADSVGLEHRWFYDKNVVLTQQQILKYGMIEPNDTEAGVVLQAIEWMKHEHYDKVIAIPPDKLEEGISNLQDVIREAPILTEATVDIDKKKFKIQTGELLSINDLLPHFWYTYEMYKKEHQKIDYSDMLLYAYIDKFVPDTRVLLVDEFHDLSRLKYEIYKLWKQKHERTYIMLDDDQSIFQFIGASAEFGISEQKTASRVTVLSQSFRLPSMIKNYTTSFIERNIRPHKRVHKEFAPRKEGGILWNVKKYVDFPAFVKEHLAGTGFILTRTNYHLKEVTKMLLSDPELVIPYRYIRPDAISYFNTQFVNLVNAIIKYDKQEGLTNDEVYALLLRIKKDDLQQIVKPGMIDLLRQKPRESYPFEFIVNNIFSRPILSYDLIQHLKIDDDLEKFILTKAFKKAEPIELPIKLQIGTIHSAKGLQADTVFLINNITRRIERSMSKSKENYENEARVWYVGMTRAKERLYIINDLFKTKRIFPI